MHAMCALGRVGNLSAFTAPSSDQENEQSNGTKGLYVELRASPVPALGIILSKR